jgi:AGCS family alanine or glycine:cation symporter
MDLAYALMLIPNMIAVLLLAPKVNAAASDYFKRYKEGRL